MTVRYELASRRDGILIYNYYPNGDKWAVPGSLRLDEDGKNAKVIEVASTDEVTDAGSGVQADAVVSHLLYQLTHFEIPYIGVI